jgi:uncharacterized membrane protein
MSVSPSVQPELAEVVHKNIRALLQARRQEEHKKSTAEVIADRVTAFAGSMVSVAIHGTAFGGWILWNCLPGLPKFDPYPFVMLAMTASVEAIFLSTFVLISQNRQAQISEKSAQLDLQVNLLAEHEVTRLITLTERIAHKVGVDIDQHDLDDLKKDVSPVRVLDEIERIGNVEETGPADRETSGGALGRAG